MRWAEHVARVGEMDMRNVYKIFVRKVEGNNHLGEVSVSGGIIWIISKRGVEVVGWV
jgi:hypothetical protein